jgi:hypothetical protein
MPLKEKKESSKEDILDFKMILAGIPLLIWSKQRMLLRSMIPEAD